MEAKLTKEQKALIVVSLLPVIADMTEDLELFRLVKNRANLFIEEVRKVDNFIIGNAEFDAQAQQVNLQISFTQWLKTHLNDE